MDEPIDTNQTVTPIRYELAITIGEARFGTKKVLPKHGKRLEVNIPAGAAAGSTIKLTDALQLTDDHPGDSRSRVISA